MKKIYISILLALLVFIVVGSVILVQRNSQTRDSVFDNGNFFVNNGYIYKDGSSKKYSGTIIDTVSDRVIKYNVVDGKKNGEFTIFYSTGKVQIQGTMKDNKNNGLWKYYYQSGALESEGEFKDDLVSDKWTWYYKNGKIKETGIFIKGKREGKWTSYFINGEIKAIFLFRNGNVIDVINAGDLKNA
jgi:antitoxin component YwqK of YwqJK toxin-antitoxin module